MDNPSETDYVLSNTLPCAAAAPTGDISGIAETLYVLSNPVLMRQIRQFEQNASKAYRTKSNNSDNFVDLDYILEHPDLMQHIQSIIDTHKQKHHALSSIS